MKKKTPRQKLIKKLDASCREYVVTRDEHICQWCGKLVGGKNCQWSHIITRSEHLLRWNPVNSVVLCYACHRKWHSNPLIATEWFKNKFPERYEEIIDLNNKSRPIMVSELEEMLEKFDTPKPTPPGYWVPNKYS